MRKALIVQGGWQGHEPVQVSEVFCRVLRAEGFDVTISDTLDSLLDLEVLKQLHLLVPAWTMGTISKEQSANASLAVASGSAWRLSRRHVRLVPPGHHLAVYDRRPVGGPSRQRRHAVPGQHPVVIQSDHGGYRDFEVKSEQYYVHVDPAVEVLASTLFPNPAAVGFHSSNPLCAVPVVWTKRWGHGRVFYNSLGHHADIFDASEPIELMRRGFLWAADGKDRAVQLGLKLDDFLPKT